MAAKKSTPTPKPTPKPAPQGISKTASDINKSFGQSGTQLSKGLKDLLGGIASTTAGAVGGLGAYLSSRPQPAKPASPVQNRLTLDQIAANSGIGVGYKSPTSVSKIVTPKASTSMGSGMSKPTASKPLSDLLRVQGIDEIYSPVTNFLAQQETAAKDRYAVNAANIKNIFSSLTGLTAQDSARITKQFKDSLTASKADLAARTAEARAGAAAGAAQATVTGAERGGGPEMVASPVQQAVDESIGRSNEYATTWQALQAANEQQAQADISARGAGYGQQQVGAIQQLAQNLEDRLLAIGGNTAQVQSDIAQAKFGQETNIAQANYAEAIAARDAAQRAAAAASRPTADKTPAIDQIRQQLGPRFDGLLNGLTDAYAEAYTRQNPKGSTKVTKPTASDVMAIWVGSGGGTDVLNEANTVARILYNK
jgi:hypothetical protein